jgi:hypothetical protein
MIISNSNAAKAKQKMSSYSHRGAKAGRVSVSSYLLDNAVIKVGDHFAANRPIYLSEDYKTNLLTYFDPESEQLKPDEDIILASFSLDNPGVIASFDVALEWYAEDEPSPDPEEPPYYYNYTPCLYTIFRNSEGTELRRIELTITSSIGKFTYNANVTASYVHYIFDAVISKIRLGGYTEDALNCYNLTDPDDPNPEFPVSSVVQRLKDGMDVAGKTLKFSNEFFSLIRDMNWSFANECCISAGITPVAGATVELVQFNSNGAIGSFAIVLSIMNWANYEFAIMLYTSDENITIAKYTTKSNGEGAWIIDNVSYSFPGHDLEDNPVTIVPTPVNYYFWNIRSDLITVSTDEAVDTNIFYTSVITGTGPAKYDTDQMLYKLSFSESALKNYNIDNTATVAGLISDAVLFVDTSNLDPQYSLPADTFCLQLVYYITSNDDRMLFFDAHSHDDTRSLKVTVGVSQADGLWIQDVTANGNTVPLSILGQLRWCIGIIESGQGFKRAVLE